MNISFELADMLSGAGAGLLIGLLLGGAVAVFTALGGAFDQGPAPSFTLAWTCLGFSVVVGIITGALGWSWWVTVLTVVGIFICFLLLVAIVETIKSH